MKVESGRLTADRAKRVQVNDALVDTGATLLSMRTKLIHQLGLKKTGSKRVTSSVRVGEAAMYEPVRLTIQGRSFNMDVMEVPTRFLFSSASYRSNILISSGTCEAER